MLVGFSVPSMRVRYVMRMDCHCSVVVADTPVGLVVSMVLVVCRVAWDTLLATAGMLTHLWCGSSILSLSVCLRWFRLSCVVVPDGFTLTAGCASIVSGCLGVGRVVCWLSGLSTPPHLHRYVTRTTPPPNTTPILSILSSGVFGWCCLCGVMVVQYCVCDLRLDLCVSSITSCR